jgi:hypothetical protein
MSHDGFSDRIVIRSNGIIILTASADRLWWLRLLRRRGRGRVGEEGLNGSLNIFIFAFLGLVGGDRSGNMKIRQCFRWGLWWPRNAGGWLDIDNRVSI